MKKIVLITIVLLLHFITNAIPAKSDAKVDLSFQEKIPAWLTEYDVPAVGIGVIENGKVKYVNVFGKLQKNIPAPDNAIFNVASITKTVVAMLTLKLVETGQWDLDEPLYKYWIDPDVANDPLHKKLTTRHILTHQTGFLNWRWNHPTGKLTFDFEPGTKFQYSGEGFKYLRNALERKFKKPIEQLTDSILFTPLDMKDTRHSWDKNMDESRFAAWHDAEGEQYKMSYKTGVSAADNLLTTIEDYCKFGAFVINGAGISKRLFNEMVRPQAKVKEHSGMGLGWLVVKGLPNGEYAIVHSGSDFGVKTMAILLPKSKRGIVVFTNGDNGMSIYNNVIKGAFDIGDAIYNYLYERPTLPEIVTVSDEILEKYRGHYKRSNGRVHLISKKGNELRFSGAGWSRLTIYPESKHKFFVKEFDTVIEFVEDKNGGIEKLIIYSNGKMYAEAIRMK